MNLKGGSSRKTDSGINFRMLVLNGESIHRFVNKSKHGVITGRNKLKQVLTEVRLDGMCARFECTP
jgi:hypothetical protein